MEKTVQKSEINTALDEINGLIFPYALAWVHVYDDVELLEVNARYMSKQTLDQLSSNIKEDNFLSQLPFCIKETSGKYKVISGNHRILAARKADLTYVLVLYQNRENTSEEKEIAIQISHNEITGKDNMEILQSLYAKINNIDVRKYTGIDEVKLFGTKITTLPSISDKDLMLHELKIYFTDEEIENYKKVVEELEKKVITGETSLNIYNFEMFIKTLTEIKIQSNIKNTTIAFIKMIEICEEWIKQNDKI